MAPETEGSTGRWPPRGTNVLKAIATWTGTTLFPAVCTGLVFAAVLGRFTAESDFTRMIGQDYLRPFQEDYHRCIITMQALDDHWLSLDRILRDAVTDRAGGAPNTLVSTADGYIDTTADDSGKTVFARIQARSQQAAACIEANVRQMSELARLVGLHSWFEAERNERIERLKGYGLKIDESRRVWLNLGAYDQWDIAYAAVDRANDRRGILRGEMRSAAEKYLKAVSALRGQLAEIHSREDLWLNAMNVRFTNELSGRSSRHVGFFLRNVFTDVSPSDGETPTPAATRPSPTGIWTPPLVDNPPPPECTCRVPDGMHFARLGDP